MMMERAKTAPAPDAAPAQQEKPATTTATATAAPANASAEERVQDLERRLNDLGGESVAAAAAPVAPAAVAPAPAAAAPAAAKPVQTGQNNPLLKRIQAAQERARLAEQKEKDAKAAAAAEIERKQRAEEEEQRRAAEQARIAKAQSALRSVAGRALEDKQQNEIEMLLQLEGKSPEAMQGVPIMKTMDPPPPAFDSMEFPPAQQRPAASGEMVGHGMNSRKLSRPATSAPPMEAFQEAPPSFDFVEQQQQQQAAPAASAAPPSFDFLEQQQAQESAPPAPTAPAESPSAPPAMAMDADHLQGIMPVAPPSQYNPQQQQQHGGTQVDMPPPPSFAQFEHRQTAPPPTTTTAETFTIPGEDEGVFDYDLDGNPLSPQQRQALLDEQRLLYESIMKEKAANDAAIAKARGDAFDLRSSNAAVRAMDGGGAGAAAVGGMGGMEAQTMAMDNVGRNVSEYPAAAAAQERAAASTETHAQESAQEEDESDPARRMVKIGNNQTVALHGQDRTKKAIKEGTAILVQCINCQNWMQVTDTATLMFCPVCQVVSPVIQQNEVMTKEEAIQLTMDRKLAEKLQAEAYADQEDGDGEEEGKEEEEGYFAKLFGGTATSPTSSATAASATARAASAGAGAQDSWWNKMASIVSYGEPAERGTMGVSRPPGAPTASPVRASVNDSKPAARSSPTHAEESRGLLAPVVDGNEANLPSGRVAESKPLFSCIADGMSNAATSMFGAGEDVHGVDSSSLLVTNAGRGVGGGDYSQLPDRENL